MLRDAGFATARVDGPRRPYAIDAAPLKEVDAWLAQFRGFWGQKLEALATEVERGKRKSRQHADRKSRARQSFLR